MRVLINALSARSGGGWTYLVNILDELDRDRRGMELSFLVRDDVLSRLPPTDIDIRPIRYRNAAHRVLYEQLRLPWIARSFDLLYCVADTAPLVKTVPTIVALRNLNIYDRRFYNNARLRLFDRGARAGLRGIRLAIFPSNSARDQISSILGLETGRTGVVPHGIDASRFANRIREAELKEQVVDDCERDRYLLIPAAVEKHKNIEIVVDALTRMSDSRLQAWVAGRTDTDPDYVSSLEERARRLGVSDRFKLLGQVEYDRIPALYRGAEALVFPSLLETFGHPLLEGMSAGIPIVVSDLPVFHEIGADASWYFDPKDGADLARKVDSMRADIEKRDQMIRTGLARAHLYSWKTSVDRLTDLFRNVIDQN
jgi:glycosyltransferase involved in cell wall biosynthesis